MTDGLFDIVKGTLIYIPSYVQTATSLASAPITFLRGVLISSNKSEELKKALSFLLITAAGCLFLVVIIRGGEQFIKALVVEYILGIIYVSLSAAALLFAVKIVSPDIGKINLLPFAIYTTSVNPIANLLLEFYRVSGGGQLLVWFILLLALIIYLTFWAALIGE